MRCDYKDIKRLTDEGNLHEALSKINDALQLAPDDARLLYLKGNVFMKRGEWGDAITMFCKAESLDPNGPAHEARRMLDDIMNFYNKDMYNH